MLEAVLKFSLRNRLIVLVLALALIGFGLYR
jgi:Cu/Ag efflux pump CusA